MIIHNPILTGSLVFNGTNLTTSNLVTTGSNNFTGSQAISGSLNVTGNITATTLVVQTVSSSVIYSSGSNVFGNNIANTQVFTGSMLVTGSSTILGNLGVGGTPGERLSVTGPLGLQGFIRWSDGVSTSAFLGITGSTAFIHANNNILAFGASSNNNFAATITLNSGNVGIGTSSPTSIFHVSTSGLLRGRFYSSANASFLDIENASNSFYVGTDDSSGSQFGVGGYSSVLWRAAAYPIIFATNNVERMKISSDGTLNLGTYHSTAKFLPGADSNHYLRYNSSLDGLELSGYSGVMFSTLGGTERMRITTYGVVKLGDGSTSRPIMQYSNFGYSTGAWKTVILGSSNSNYTTDGVTLCFNVDVSGNTSGAYSGDGREYIFRNVGSFITPNSSNNGYNTLMSWNSSGVVTVTTSDYRAKEDLKSFNALPIIEAIKLYDFRWIELQDRMHGVLAHELQEIVPYAVHGEKDGERMQGVDYSKLVPIMLKAIQELKAEIEILKTK